MEYFSFFYINFVTSMAHSLNLTMFYQVMLIESLEPPKGSGFRPYTCLKRNLRGMSALLLNLKLGRTSISPHKEPCSWTKCLYLIFKIKQVGKGVWEDFSYT